MSKPLPRYCLHRPTGRAYVRIDGKFHYLGPYNSDASKDHYRRLISEYVTRGSVAPAHAAHMTVAELVAQHWAYARQHYGERAYAAQALERVQRCLGIVTALYGDELAASFGPRALKAVRAAMCGKGWTRGHVNQCVGVVVRAWRWAVSEELLPADKLLALKAVAGLEVGARGVAEASAVLDVPWETVRRSLRHMSPMARAIVLTLWYTGARPSEILRMRRREVDTRGDVWVYRPADHKCRWRGQGREILIGRRGQRVLRRYLVGEGDGYVFATSRGHYAVDSLRTVITMAALRAGVPHWFPYQLRHAFASRVAAEFGESTAAKLLGQRSLQSTQRYNHHHFTAGDADAARQAG